MPQLKESAAKTADSTCLSQGLAQPNKQINIYIFLMLSMEKGMATYSSILA